MEYEYDIFEIRGDGSVLWRGCIRGYKTAHAQLERLAQKTTNECFAIQLSTNTVIGRANQNQKTYSVAANADPRDGFRPFAPLYPD